jgi:signal transduction histidine kinase/ActR/RegA family two-component response regulator
LTTPSPPPATKRASRSKRERRIAFREDAAKAVTTRETTVTGREDVVLTREEAALLREGAVRHREEAAGLREETAGLREETVRAREEADLVKAQLNQYVLQLREANQGLVLATLQAQMLTEEAEQATRLKDEFLATVSHELRTPLSAITGWAQMLRLNQVQLERIPHAVAAIDRNAGVLLHLIEDLLDVSRIAAGKLSVGSERVNLVEVAECALETIRHAAVAKGINLTLSAETSSINPVLGDARRLQQVVWNLLSNAIKFTPEGGHVDVGVRCVTSGTELRVTDTGQGIDPRFLPLVFEPFRQADASPGRRGGGLGLGLALVRQIVELHGGRVRAESAGPGRGTTMIVTLPILPKATRSFEPEVANPLNTATGGHLEERLESLDRLRVVVVEHSVDARDLVTLVLQAAGATVTGVSSTQEALACLDCEHVDMLVSDIALPGADGYVLIQQIRRQEAERGGFLPAIALTGYVGADDRMRALAAGYQAHITKPAAPAALTREIAKLAASAIRRP